MCFSVEVQKELKRIAERFSAEVLIEDEVWYEELKKMGSDPEFIKRVLNLTRKPTSNFFKEPGEDNRIFPGYFTWVMVEENGKRVLKRMRYRIRPAGSRSEIPTKFNVFNARLDSLGIRETWKKVFMQKHGLLPFHRFYEWVEFQGQKRLISFSPKDREIMWAPCLFDYWENTETGFGFYSFAILTDDPPPEVQEMGHDRCPIFLQERHISTWLSPRVKTKDQILSILRDKEEVYFSNQWASIA